MTQSDSGSLGYTPMDTSDSESLEYAPMSTSDSESLGYAPGKPIELILRPKPQPTIPPASPPDPPLPQAMSTSDSEPPRSKPIRLKLTLKPKPPSPPTCLLNSPMSEDEQAPDSARTASTAGSTPPPSPTKPVLRKCHNPEALASELSKYLVDYGKYPNAPNVHPRPVTYPNQKAKDDWSELPDADDRDTFEEWGRNMWAPGRVSSLAMFSTWTKPYENDENGEDPWHIWAVFVVETAKKDGHAVVIYDCDPRRIKGQWKNKKTIHRPPKGIMFDVQAELVDYLRYKQNLKIKGLFYNADQTRSGKNQCMKYTMQWMSRMVQAGDVRFAEIGGKGKCADPRVKNCVRITRFR
ncbi:uncharacterized protein DSM5745_08777 [Aspergillus mulundensis]|uniref:Uncharacterized protein n=1 Tax=Aspergillus mulundensis TaxID=1810919 RepID=A0A3D8R4W0_9EURO|nr:hypothetical protein DSM5745_08777 [Aspergillus mulundensis]RDW69017.1 hypothetical protein DSM5745_08777 [Aspergillus mulundensis]